jgi:hypothetical protein
MKKRQRRKKEVEKVEVGSVGRTPPVFDEEACKTLAIEVWRLRRSLKALPSGGAMGSVSVSIDRLEELLRAMAVEVHDPCGEPYDDGMTLSVSLFEKSKSLANGVKRIAETIMPTVYWKGQMVQPGKVIVEVGDAEV